MGFFDKPFEDGGALSYGIGGSQGGGLFASSGDTGEEAMKSAKRLAAKQFEFAKRTAKPFIGVSDQFYQPAMEGAFKSYQSMDQVPGIDSDYARMREQLAAQRASSGLAGSGTAFSQDRLLALQEARDRFNRILQARLAKGGALSGLGSTVSNNALNASNLASGALRNHADMLMQIRDRQAADYAANQAGKGEMMGSLMTLPFIL